MMHRAYQEYRAYLFRGGVSSMGYRDWRCWGNKQDFYLETGLQEWGPRSRVLGRVFSNETHAEGCMERLQPDIVCISVWIAQVHEVHLLPGRALVGLGTGSGGTPKPLVSLTGLGRVSQLQPHRNSLTHLQCWGFWLCTYTLPAY